MAVRVTTYETAHPGDTAGLREALRELDASRIRRLAVLAKTEGNSDVNDFSRSYALQSVSAALERFGGPELLLRSTLLFSSGCEGAISPFGILFLDVEDTSADQVQATPTRSALVLGRARSRSLGPGEVGTMAHVDLVAAAVTDAIADAGVTQADVGVVIVKSPVMSLTPPAPGIGPRRVTSARAKAVAALGAGIGLGEVRRAAVDETAIDRDLTLYARRAMVFSGNEVDHAEVLLLANRPGAYGALSVRTGSMADMLDGAGIRDMFAAAGCALDSAGRVAAPSRVRATLVKCGVAPDGSVRGRRTTITRSHIDPDKHVRATVSGVVGSILGDPQVFISANTVHQAPPGGGLCACVVAHDPAG